MTEQGDPFLGGGEIGAGASDQFVPAVRVPDEPGFAERLDDSAVADDFLEHEFQFHVRTLPGRVGQRLSRRRFIQKANRGCGQEKGDGGTD